MMHRDSNWPGKLEEFLSANRSRPFRYGDWDCFQLARLAMLAMTGVDIAAPFRAYSSRFGYQRQMFNYCASLSILAFAEKLLVSLRCSEVPVELAGRGDIAVVNESDPAFGLIALNGRCALALSSSGEIERLPLSSIITAWRI